MAGISDASVRVQLSGAYLLAPGGAMPKGPMQRPGTTPGRLGTPRKPRTPRSNASNASRQCSSGMCSGSSRVGASGYFMLFLLGKLFQVSEVVILVFECVFRGGARGNALSLPQVRLHLFLLYIDTEQEGLRCYCNEESGAGRLARGAFAACAAHGVVATPPPRRPAK